MTRKALKCSNRAPKLHAVSRWRWRNSPPRRVSQWTYLASGGPCAAARRWAGSRSSHAAPEPAENLFSSPTEIGPNRTEPAAFMRKSVFTRHQRRPPRSVTGTEFLHPAGARSPAIRRAHPPKILHQPGANSRDPVNHTRPFRIPQNMVNPHHPFLQNPQPSAFKRLPDPALSVSISQKVVHGEH